MCLFMQGVLCSVIFIQINERRGITACPVVEGVNGVQGNINRICRVHIQHKIL